MYGGPGYPNQGQGGMGMQGGFQGQGGNMQQGGFQGQGGMGMQGGFQGQGGMGMPGQMGMQGQSQMHPGMGGNMQGGMPGMGGQYGQMGGQHGQMGGQYGGMGGQYGGGMGGQPGGMQGGMGGGMQGGMQGGMGGASYGNPAQWNNYQMQQYNIPRQSIEQNAETIFFKYDHDQNGEVEMMRMPQMLQEFCMMSGTQQPNPQDVMYMQYTFDVDGDGFISFQEWIRALKMLGGHRKYDRGYLQQHRNTFGFEMGGKFKGGKHGKGKGRGRGRGRGGMGRRGKRFNGKGGKFGKW
jgi:EF hand